MGKQKRLVCVLSVVGENRVDRWWQRSDVNKIVHLRLTLGSEIIILQHLCHIIKL